MKELIRNQLLQSGVKNLREFGYPNCTKENILTDKIYSAFFTSMLEDNKGKAGYLVDKVIDSLLAEISNDTTNPI